MPPFPSARTAGPPAAGGPPNDPTMPPGMGQEPDPDDMAQGSPDELMALLQLLGVPSGQQQAPVPPAAAPGMASGFPPQPPGVPGADPLLAMLSQLMGSQQQNPMGGLGMGQMMMPPAAAGGMPPMPGGMPGGMGGGAPPMY